MMNLWDEKAKTYPKFEAGGTFENKVLDFMEDFGLVLSGKNVLDVGCGTGIYTLNMALRGAKVEGVDISNLMLENLRKSANEHGVAGVKTILGDFASFEGGEFDIATCFMSPALSSEKVREKFIEIPKIGFCVLGWKSRHNNLQDELYPAMGVKNHAHRDVKALKELLEARDISYNSILLDDVWEKTLDFEATVQNQIWHLKMHEATVDEARVRDILASFQNSDGKIKSVTKVKAELIIALKDYSL